MFLRFFSSPWSIISLCSVLSDSVPGSVTEVSSSRPPARQLRVPLLYHRDQYLSCSNPLNALVLPSRLHPSLIISRLTPEMSDHRWLAVARASRSTKNTLLLTTPIFFFAPLDVIVTPDHQSQGIQKLMPQCHFLTIHY